MIEGLEKMLAKGVDNALLRFGLGKGYLDAGDAERAAEHLQRCVCLLYTSPAPDRSRQGAEGRLVISSCSESLYHVDIRETPEARENRGLKPFSSCAPS